MSDVPDEILREILSKLPVTPLLRFRCVSKSWKSLIDNQQFIKHHLNHSRKTNSSLNIILDILDSSCRLYSVDFDVLNETNMATFKEVSHPLNPSYCATEILGLCDGLLVLKNYDEDCTIFWNPSLRQFHVIPCCGYEFLRSNIFHGFGYDVVSDDYKLVKIFQIYEKGVGGINFKVKVYSLKSDSWRWIPDFPYYLWYDYTRKDGVLANGALHWIVSEELKSDANYSIVAFDIGTEEYRLMPLPKLANNDFDMFLGVLGGCLNVMYYNGDEDHVDVWVMKEYGVEESWSLLFAFDGCDFHYSRLLAYSKCGRKVLLRSEKEVLMWYDLDKKSSDVLQIPLGDSEEVHICFVEQGYL